jgi:hypothetical protein
MADAKPKNPTPFVLDVAKEKGKAAKPKATTNNVAAATTTTPAAHGHRGRRCRSLRCAWACACACLAVVAAALALLVLSLTVLRVRDPTLSMESVRVKWFHVRFDARTARPLRINVTLVGHIVVANPNYASMRFGASATEIFVDGVPGCVGVGRAPPGEVPARAATRVSPDLDVFVDRVAPAVVAEVLFGTGRVRLASRTAVDGRVSVLGGLYGRRTVRVAMQCAVELRVSEAVVVAGTPSCVADFGR